MDSTLKLCIIGNLIGRNEGYITTQGQILADLFAKENYSVISASSKINRVLRLKEIIQTIVLHKNIIDVLILEVYSGQSFLIAETVSLICQTLKIPLILVLHGGNLPEFSKRFPKWTKRVLSRADVLVSPSTFLADKMQIGNLQIKIIPNVIDFENYPFKIRRKISPNLIWMRSFHPIYNPQMAVETLSLVRNEFPNAKLIMAGVDKGLEENMKLMAKRMQFDNAISFPGFLDINSKKMNFEKSDIYLNTNKIDNMPVSVIEACAMGLPVVATDVGGISHIIKNGENGLLVPSDDALSMALGIRSLLQNPELTEKISKNGRQLAEKSSWKAVKIQWETLFSNLINENKFIKKKSKNATSGNYAGKSL